MLSTNYNLFEIRFNNTNETFIFNTTNESTNQLAKVLQTRKPLYFDTVKQYDRSKSKFIRVKKSDFLKWIDFNTELFELLK
jgi:hypothetical protein